MCVRKADSVFFPLLAILAFVGVIASTVGLAEDDHAPSIFQRLVGLATSRNADLSEAKQGEPFQPRQALITIDLTDKVNKKLSDGTITVDNNTLESLPQGKQDFAGVRFQVIDGVMQLTSRGRGHFPESIEGIPVNATAGRLYVLHATQGGEDRLRDGKQIGSYIIHYEDGSEAVWPIIYGEDVRDWWNMDGSKKASRGRVAWTGKNPGATRFGYSLRLYVSAWDNPHPSTKISHVDYVSAKYSWAAPFCVALTLEKPAAGVPTEQTDSEGDEHEPEA